MLYAYMQLRSQTKECDKGHYNTLSGIRGSPQARRPMSLVGERFSLRVGVPGRCAKIQERKDRQNWPRPNSRVTSRQIRSGLVLRPIQAVGRADLLTNGVFCRKRSEEHTSELQS